MEVTYLLECEHDQARKWISVLWTPDIPREVILAGAREWANDQVEHPWDFLTVYIPQMSKDRIPLDP